MKPSLQERTAAFRSVAEGQPGSMPYDNHRPIYVRKHSAGQSLAELLRRIEPYHEHPDRMQADLEKGWIKIDSKTPRLDQTLVAGNAIHLVLPNTVEPRIGTELTVLHEDDDLVVVDKPSPLPVHPCGRYNRNTLVLLARLAWPDIELKPVHRLDANTTGVMAFAKNVGAARWLMAEFKAQKVQKEYIAKVHGSPSKASFIIDAEIEARPSQAGTRQVGDGGQPARTEVELWRTLPDDTSLLLVRPITGRTNQIRLHLLDSGLPIVGDAVYGSSSEISQGMTQANNRLGLHAHRLILRHPSTKEWSTFESTLPNWFSEIT